MPLDEDRRQGGCFNPPWATSQEFRRASRYCCARARCQGGLNMMVVQVCGGCVASPISAERERRSESDQSDFSAAATRVAIRIAALASPGRHRYW